MPFTHLLVLYELVSTCINDDASDYCPVQVQINHPEIIDHYKGKYLLQGYNREGTIMYTRALKSSKNPSHLKLTFRSCHLLGLQSRMALLHISCW